MTTSREPVRTDGVWKVRLRITTFVKLSKSEEHPAKGGIQIPPYGLAFWGGCTKANFYKVFCPQEIAITIIIAKLQ